MEAHIIHRQGSGAVDTDDLHPEGAPRRHPRDQVEAQFVSPSSQGLGARDSPVICCSAVSAAAALQVVVDEEVEAATRDSSLGEDAARACSSRWVPRMGI